jgi:diguanylate cyclase (GGDEF)-like protein
VTSSSKNVADVFIKSMRKRDVAGRFGGEEFLLVMHGADRQHAVDRAEKLRGAIRSIEATFSGQKLGQITASFGVATFPGSGQSAAELIDEADKALYAAKHSGRDRAVAAANYAGAEAR